MVLECPGSSPCSAPSRIALGINNQACAEPWLISSANDGMAGYSQVFGDFLELVDRPPLILGQRHRDILKAVIEVILN